MGSLAGSATRVMNPSPTPAALLAMIGVLLVLLTALGTSYSPDPGEGPIVEPTGMATVTAIVVVAGLLYLAAVAIVLKFDLSPRALWGVLACAVVMRSLLLVTPPFLSTDIYRYVWDGRVQSAGINPYRYMPADPQLVSLRDAQIYPHINRATSATTIYPPVAQGIFLVVSRVSATVTGMKLTMMAFEALAVGIVLYLLPLSGLPRQRVLIYAWNPVAAWEIAGNGHIDAAAIGFIALALLAFAHRRPALTGAALACATLVKLLPICLFPALWRPWGWRMPVALAAVLVLGYLPYLGVGTSVLGYLPGYAAEEGLGSGAAYYPLFLLSQLTSLPPLAGVAYLAAGSIALTVLALWVASRRRSPTVDGKSVIMACGDGLLLATAVIVLLTPNHPWYFVWLLLFACFVPSVAVLFLNVLSFAIYLSYYDPNRVAQGVMYGVFGLLLLVELWPRSNLSQRRCMPLAREASRNPSCALASFGRGTLETTAPTLRRTRQSLFSVRPSNGDLLEQELKHVPKCHAVKAGSRGVLPPREAASHDQAIHPVREEAKIAGGSTEVDDVQDLAGAA